MLNLLDSGVQIKAIDYPEADRFLLSILAAVSEKERLLISERTRAALGATKRRGTRLGSRTPMTGLKIAWRAKQERATAYAERMAPVIKQVQKAGCVSLRQITFALNARGFKSPNGKDFKPQTVADLLKRTGLKP